MDHDWVKIVSDGPDEETKSAINLGMPKEICRRCGFVRQFLGGIVITRTITSCDEMTQIKNSHDWLSPIDGIVSFATSLVNNPSISVKENPNLEMLVGDVDAGEEIYRFLEKIQDL